MLIETAMEVDLKTISFSLTSFFNRFKSSTRTKKQAGQK